MSRMVPFFLFAAVVICCRGQEREGSLLLRREADAWTAQSRQEFLQWRSRQDQEFRTYQAKIAQEWGEFRRSTTTVYVEYDTAGNSMAAIDFKEGVVRVEVLKKEETPEQIQTRLEAATSRILLSAGSSLEPTPEPDAVRAPLLNGQVVDNIDSSEAVRFSQRLVDSVGVVDSIGTAVILFTLKSDHVRRRAAEILPIVERYSAEYGISRAHVLATIHVESWFNPRAVSSADAVGLMQLVADKGGRDAYRHVFGVDAIPRRHFLLDPENNIRLGCAYIHLLRTRDFGPVIDSASNLFCTVAGYNTGAGNVARAFTGQRNLTPAIRVINSIKGPDRVYGFLIKHLPYPETRTYLQTVISTMHLYNHAEGGTP